MACVALTCLMSTIELEFLQPIPRVSLPEDATIKSFFDNLSSFQDFLQQEESASGGDGGAKVRDLEIEIRDFALEAEDSIEIQLSNFLLAKGTDSEDKAYQELHQTLREAAEKAAELLFNILNTTASINNESEEVVELDGSLLCHPPRLENKMVGREDDYATMKYQLKDGCTYRSGLKMIWIVGISGIGKTYLANSVYEDPIMKAHFQVQVWITMPQKYNLREILCNLLLSIAAPTEQPTEIINRISSPCELAYQVRKCLMGRRFLIVLDNFWNSQAWVDIKPLFPNNRNGSRILLTTTHFDRYSYARPSYYFHNMTLLNSTNSWDVFCNVVLSLNKDPMAPIFEKIRSREIVEKCDGLPQLIVAVAKRLSTCNNIQQEGKRIEKELDSIGILDRSALTFVFSQLPLRLKVCFLYLGVFPNIVKS